MPCEGCRKWSNAPGFRFGMSCRRLPPPYPARGTPTTGVTSTSAAPAERGPTGRTGNAGVADGGGEAAVAAGAAVPVAAAGAEAGLTGVGVVDAGAVAWACEASVPPCPPPPLHPALT